MVTINIGRLAQAECAMQGLGHTDVVLDFITGPASMSFKRHYFKCHQRPQIMKDTIELSCQSNKLISKH